MDTSRRLRFLWWNTCDFAHYDHRRAGRNRWAACEAAYDEKARRVAAGLRAVTRGEPWPLVGLGETTREAAERIRDAMFPGYEIALAEYEPGATFQVAVLYDANLGLTPLAPIWVPDVPLETRGMVPVEYVGAGGTVLFVFCHWTAFDEQLQRETREDCARHLRGYLFEYLRAAPEGEPRHAVVLGDLNSEPFDKLFTYRLPGHRDHRRAKRISPRPDATTRRVRLYNCAWRWLGEQTDGPAHFAGTYFGGKPKTWRTYDHILVSSGLLGSGAPRLVEGESRVAYPLDVQPDHPPRKFAWTAERSVGLSDHLPIIGTLEV